MSQSELSRERYARGYPDGEGSYRNIGRDRGADSLYEIPSKPSQSIYGTAQTESMADVYADSGKEAAKRAAAMRSLLDEYKFERGNYEIQLAVGAQFAGIYNNTLKNITIKDTAGVDIGLENMFSAISIGPAISLGFLAKINTIAALEVKANYSLVPFSYILHSGSTDNNFGHRLDVLGLLRIYAATFGKRGQHRLSYLVGVDAFYNNTGGIYNGYNIYSGDVVHSMDVSANDIMRRSLFNYFGASFVGGVRIGMMFSTKYRFIADFLLGVGPAVFFDSNGPIVNSQGLANNQASPVSKTNAGLAATGIISLAQHIKIGKSNVWFTVETKGQVRALVIPLVEYGGSYNNTTGVFGSVDVLAGLLLAF